MNQARSPPVWNGPAKGGGQDLHQLRMLPLAPPFDDADLENLAIRCSQIVLAGQLDEQDYDRPVPFGVA